jgi:hypothetical protein
MEPLFGLMMVSLYLYAQKVMLMEILLELQMGMMLLASVTA